MFERIEVPFCDKFEEEKKFPPLSMRRSLVLKARKSSLSAGLQENPTIDIVLVLKYVLVAGGGGIAWLVSLLFVPTFTYLAISLFFLVASVILLLARKGRIDGVFKLPGGSFKPSQLEKSTDTTEKEIYKSMKTLEQALGIEARMWIPNWRLPIDRAIPATPIYRDLPKGDRYSKFTEKGVIAQSSSTEASTGSFGAFSPTLARGIGPAPIRDAPIPPQVPLRERTAKLVNHNFRSPGYYTTFLGAEDIFASSHPGPFLALPGDEITTLLQCKAVEKLETRRCASYSWSYFGRDCRKCRVQYRNGSGSDAHIERMEVCGSDARSTRCGGIL